MSGPAVDNVFATASPLSSPSGIRSDKDGQWFISDSANSILRVVDLSGKY